MKSFFIALNILWVILLVIFYILLEKKKARAQGNATPQKEPEAEVGDKEGGKEGDKEESPKPERDLSPSESVPMMAGSKEKAKPIKRKGMGILTKKGRIDLRKTMIYKEILSAPKALRKDGWFF